MSMPYVRPKAPPEEYDKWNDRRSYHKLQSLLSANFANDSIYYIVTLSTKGFNMDYDGVLSEFRADVIRKLHPLVSDLKYIYTVRENNGKYEIHIVTNAKPEQVHNVCFRFWMIDDLRPKLRVNELSLAYISKAMTTEHCERKRLRNKRMYIPSKGLICSFEQEEKPC